MSNNLDPVYILKLIEASEILTDAVKPQLIEKLPEFTVVDMAELQVLLEKEQEINKAYYEKIAEIKKISAEKQVQLIYDEAEAELAQEEANILAELNLKLEDIEELKFKKPEETVID